MVKMIIFRFHVLRFILIIELMIILNFFSIQMRYSIFRNRFLRFIFIVVIVLGAAIGLSIVISVARFSSKEIEFSIINVYQIKQALANVAYNLINLNMPLFLCFKSLEPFIIVKSLALSNTLKHILNSRHHSLKTTEVDVSTFI